MTMRKPLYPGWRTMTGAQRYNARLHRIFDEARRLEAEKRAKESTMTREMALPYVAYCVDDALAERKIADMPANARLVGWQCGFEPLFVAVWSYLGDGDDCLPDPAEAAEYATDLLVEKKWFSGEPTEPDYIL